jgi:hypothetical protein
MTASPWAIQVRQGRGAGVPLLDANDVEQPFKHFCPPYGDEDASRNLSPDEAEDLKMASLVNCTFVFRRAAQALPPPPPPPPPAAVALIVCFRIQPGQRRAEELAQFVPHMLGLLAGAGAARHHIFVVQQKASQEEDGVKFNRGKLLNIGFALAAAQVGFGRSVALYCRSSTLYQIC